MLLETLLRWGGHVSPRSLHQLGVGSLVSLMEDHRLPKVVRYGVLSSGHRNTGADKKRYED